VFSPGFLSSISGNITFIVYLILHRQGI